MVVLNGFSLAIAKKFLVLNWENLYADWVVIAGNKSIQNVTIQKLYFNFKILI